MSYINLRLTQGQAKHLLDRLQADKASFLAEASISRNLENEKFHKHNKEQAAKLTPIINDLYLELNEQKECYNGR